MGTYGQPVDRESAYELLRARLDGPQGHAGAAEDHSVEHPDEPRQRRAEEPDERRRQEEGQPRTRQDEGGFLGSVMDNPAVRSMMRSAGTTLGREITRSLFGTSRRRR